MSSTLFIFLSKNIYCDNLKSESLSHNLHFYPQLYENSLYCNLPWCYYNDVGVKTCQLNLRVYNVLYLCISAPLYEARCSKNSDIGFLYVRHRSRHTSLYVLLWHPCRFWQYVNRVLRTSKLPKVVICINIICYTC